MSIGDRLLLWTDQGSQWHSVLRFFSTTIVVASSISLAQREHLKIALYNKSREARLEAWRTLFRCDCI